jgi:hypothetical protein
MTQDLWMSMSIKSITSNAETQMVNLLYFFMAGLAAEAVKRLEDSLILIFIEL